MVTTSSLVFPSLVTTPAKIFVTFLAPNHFTLLLLLYYIPTVALLEAKAQKLTFCEFLIPLVTGEVLMWLFASRAKPASADYALERRLLFGYFGLEDLLALSSGAKEVLIMFIDILLYSSVAKSLKLLRGQQDLYIRRVNVGSTALLGAAQW
jgi:hypothetical protein